LLHWGSHGGCKCCLGEDYQVLVAAAAAVELAAAVLVLKDHWVTRHLLTQDRLEVDLIPSAGHCAVGSCGVVEAPEDTHTN